MITLTCVWKSSFSHYFYWKWLLPGSLLPLSPKAGEATTNTSRIYIHVSTPMNTFRIPVSPRAFKYGLPPRAQNLSNFSFNIIYSSPILLVSSTTCCTSLSLTGPGSGFPQIQEQKQRMQDISSKNSHIETALMSCKPYKRTFTNIIQLTRTIASAALELAHHQQMTS